MSRPYDLRAWRKLRRLKLQEAPLCEPCLRIGRVVPAVIVDHVKAINDGGAILPTFDELMSMCIDCHNVKTVALERCDGRGVAFKGCDEQGLPIDPSHE